MNSTNNSNNSSSNSFKYPKNRQFFNNKSNHSQSNNSKNFNNSHNRLNENTTNDNFDNKKLRNESSTAPAFSDNNNNRNSKASQSKETNPNLAMPLFNLNYKSNQTQYQPAPFQPAVYHHHNHHSHHSHHNNHAHQNKTNNNNHLRQNQHSNHHTHNNNNNNHNSLHNQQQKNKILIEKYNKKYNLISFILLRKNDEYLKDNKFYLNDQSFYERIDYFIEKRDLTNLVKFFLNNNNPTNKNKLSDFTNSYNCNLFVYTIRKCLENQHELFNNRVITSLIESGGSGSESKKTYDSSFLGDLVDFLFSKQVRPTTFYLIDGDYPKRNLIHYSARYNYVKIAQLLVNSFKQSEEDDEDYGEAKEEDFDDADDEDEENFDENAASKGEEAAFSSVRSSKKARNSDSTENFLKLIGGEFVLAQLCMQADFNGNTPIHLAAQNNSFDLLKLINPICIKHSQLIFNEDGLNPFLLATRHSSIMFIKHLIEKSCPIENGTNNKEYVVDFNLLNSKDKLYSKNCLHYACGRGCGKDALNVIKYLTDLANKLDANPNIDMNNNNNSNNNISSSLNSTKLVLFELIGSISPLVGSIYHVAASNLTRLTSLWYLLGLYPKNGLFVSCNYLNKLDMISGNSSNNLQKIENVLDYLDFRDFTVIDCLIDSVMNLREMAPPTCKCLSEFYDFIMLQKRNKSNSIETKSNYDDDNTNNDDLLLQNDLDKDFDGQNFHVLLKKCIYKLLIEFKVKLSSLPRIKNQLQLVESMRLIVFMCKFGGNYNFNEFNNRKSTINVNISYLNDFTINAPAFESIYCQNFEAFCLNFLNAFIFCSDLLPLFAAAATQQTTASNSSSSSKLEDDQHVTINTANTHTKMGSSKCSKASSNNDTTNNNNNNNQPVTSSSLIDQLESMYQILIHFYELTDIIFNTGSHKFTEKFQTKIYSFLKSYITSLVSYNETLFMKGGNASSFFAGSMASSSSSVFIESKLTSALSSCTVDSADDDTNTLSTKNAQLSVPHSTCISPESHSSVLSSSSLFSFMSLPSSSDTANNQKQQYQFETYLLKYKNKLVEMESKIELLNKEKHPMSLKNLCRKEINYLMVKSYLEKKSKHNSLQENDHSLSALSNKYIYFMLPKPYNKLINFLTFNLIDDLYGIDCDQSSS